MAASLDELLARLKAEIEEAEHGDVDKAELARLASAVERRIAADADDGSLTSRLRDASSRFEASHPDLAGFLRTATEQLSGLGL